MTDEEDIMALRDTWVSMVANGHTEALADLVTDDYEVWAHGAPAIRGPHAVVEAMARATAAFQIAQSIDFIETVVSGEWAFQRGIERMILTPRDGGATREMTNRALLILRRGPDGRWRYARGVTNGLPIHSH
jgi:ketosteroid isomerase-like protein